MKKFAAIIMTLLLAGQVLAGMCDCLGVGDGHSCCEKSHELTLKRPPCCDEGDCLSAMEIPSTVSTHVSVRFEYSPMVEPARAGFNPDRDDSEEIDFSTSVELLRGPPPPGAEPLFITLKKILI